MLKIALSLHIILQIMSVTVFEKTPILQVFTDNECIKQKYHNGSAISVGNTGSSSAGFFHVINDLWYLFDI